MKLKNIEPLYHLRIQFINKRGKVLTYERRDKDIWLFEDKEVVSITGEMLEDAYQLYLKGNPLLKPTW